MKQKLYKSVGIDSFSKQFKQLILLIDNRVNAIKQQIKNGWNNDNCKKAIELLKNASPSYLKYE